MVPNLAFVSMFQKNDFSCNHQSNLKRLFFLQSEMGNEYITNFSTPFLRDVCLLSIVK